MLTTTIDGLWVLQVLSGVEVLAPELGLRPYLPSVETARVALAHPVAAELCAADAITAGGAVDQTLREWLTVLSRRDLALLLYVQTPSVSQTPERVVVARFAQWWVTLERCAGMVRLAGAGVATSENTAATLINSQIERLCGAMAPAALRPATLDVTALVATVDNAQSLRTFLAGHNLDADQISTLTLAADTAQSAQASIVAIQSGLTNPGTTPGIEPGAVSIIDTPSGRLVSERVIRGGKPWMIISPGSAANIAAAVLALMRRLPAQDGWHCHRKAG